MPDCLASDVLNRNSGSSHEGSLRATGFGGAASEGRESGFQNYTSGASTATPNTRNAVAQPTSYVESVKNERPDDPPRDEPLVVMGLLVYKAGTKDICHTCHIEGCTDKTIKRGIDQKRHFDAFHGGSCFICPKCNTEEARKDKIMVHCRKKHGFDYVKWRESQDL
jgi:hypothetical protein